jgi:TPR repeat protein
MWVEDYERSIDVYREIARQTPDDPKSYYDLAGTLSFLRLFQEAVEPIKTAVRLDPENVRTQDMAAMIFLNLKRYEEAFAATLKSAELGESTAMYTLVNMYEKGLGVTADQDRAVYWAERAADQGHLGAMAIMEEAYRTGRLGRPIEPRLADEWTKRRRDAE